MKNDVFKAEKGLFKHQEHKPETGLTTSTIFEESKSN